MPRVGDQGLPWVSRSGTARRVHGWLRRQALTPLPRLPARGRRIVPKTRSKTAGSIPAAAALRGAGAVRDVSESFEDLSHALRVLLEAHARAHRQGLLQVDRAEAVGNIEAALAGVLNGFHSLHDALSKGKSVISLPWYETPELATILVLRNARHHNHANKIRTMYTYYVQEARSVGSMEMYVLVDFPPEDEEASTFDVYLSWEDLRNLFSLPTETTRLKKATAEGVSEYLGVGKFREYADYYGLGEERVFFNVVPLVVNAARVLVPQIKHLVTPRSLEAEVYLTLFETASRSVVERPEVHCGPIAFMP